MCAHPGSRIPRRAKFSNTPTKVSIMSSIKAFLLFSLVAFSANAECIKVPDNFQAYKTKEGQLSFTNKEETVVISFKCDPGVKRETALESLTYFKAVQKLNENTFYYDLKRSGDSMARIYINWSPKLGLRNFAFVAKSDSKDNLKILRQFESQLK